MSALMAGRGKGRGSGRVLDVSFCTLLVRGYNAGVQSANAQTYGHQIVRLQLNNIANNKLVPGRAHPAALPQGLCSTPVDLPVTLVSLVVIPAILAGRDGKHKHERDDGCHRVQG